MSSSSIDDKRRDSNEKSLEEKADHYDSNCAVKVSVDDVDSGAVLASGLDGTLDPQEALRIRKKIDWHILPLMCVLYWVQYMDKTTLGNSAILGIKQATHLSTNQYNWLSTVFYLGYLAMEFPQNLALQRFPVAKWLSLNIFVWAVALCTHAACKNFVGLLIVRIILGICEGSISTGFLLVTGMFYTRREQTIRVGYWFLMNGFAQIVSGFISFGTLHIRTTTFEPWQWLMIMTGVITLIVSVCYWFLFPDSPATAWFLTQDERAFAIARIKENQMGVENKHFKKEQMIEAFTDPKTWLFALFAALTNVPNSLSNQKPLIINSFGFTVIQTTLISCVDGVIQIIAISTAVHFAARTGQRAYTTFLWKTPEVLGGVLILSLPWSNKIGLLFSLYITVIGSAGFVVILGWLALVTAGHTKRVTTNAVVFIAYCVGNAAAPLMWKDKYKPRNRVPWTIILICYIVCMLIALVIRRVLRAENKRRDAELPSTEYDNVYIERVGADGTVEKVHVAKEFLDLTDIQNRDFRYVL
ncbi:MFS general substrate transporter [Mycena amicta]|nr:MFS general substrate transporter [Mycena amicta]